MADDKWRMTNGGLQMADCGWQMADGRWQMANGKWRIADGIRWKADDRCEVRSGGCGDGESVAKLAASLFR